MNTAASKDCGTRKGLRRERQSKNLVSDCSEAFAWFWQRKGIQTCGKVRQILRTAYHGCSHYKATCLHLANTVLEAHRQHALRTALKLHHIVNNRCRPGSRGRKIHLKVLLGAEIVNKYPPSGPELPKVCNFPPLSEHGLLQTTLH